METLLSSFFNIRATDSFVCLFIKIYSTQQNLGRSEERGVGESRRPERGARGRRARTKLKKKNKRGGEEGWRRRMKERRS